MKVFISWSGDRSKAMAQELRDWLPTIVQSLEPFISTQDVPAGARGLNVLASQLQDCSFGILCLTQENKQGQWIHFEAGALSKVIEASRVVPLLLDLKVSDLTGPLVQFQAIGIEDRDGVFALIKGLAEQSSPSISERSLQRLFDAFWPELEAKFSQLKAAPASRPKRDARSERDILEEILLLSRNTERQMSSVINERFTGPARTPTITTIQNAWKEILVTVKGYRRVPWMLLSNATPRSVSNDVLIIEFTREADMRSFEKSGHEKYLTQAIDDLFGVPLGVVSVIQQDTSPSTHPAGEVELTGMDLIKRELGEQGVSEPESGYSDEPPF